MTRNTRISAIARWKSAALLALVAMVTAVAFGGVLSATPRTVEAQNVLPSNFNQYWVEFSSPSGAALVAGEYVEFHITTAGGVKATFASDGGVMFAGNTRLICENPVFDPPDKPQSGKCDENGVASVVGVNINLEKDSGGGIVYVWAKRLTAPRWERAYHHRVRGYTGPYNANPPWPKTFFKPNPTVTPAPGASIWIENSDRSAGDYVEYRMTTSGGVKAAFDVGGASTLFCQNSVFSPPDKPQLGKCDEHGGVGVVGVKINVAADSGAGRIFVWVKHITDTDWEGVAHVRVGTEQTAGPIGAGFSNIPASTPPTPLIISSGDVRVAEGDSGDATMTFTVTLSASPTHQVRLKATTRGGTRDGSGVAADGLAVVGRDFYQFTGRSVVFEAGATGAGLTKTVTVQIRGDYAVEADEVLTLRLNNLQSDDSRVRFATNGTRLEVTGTIANDDEAAQVSHVITASPVSVAEGDSGKTTMTFTVTLSHSPSHAVEIRATTRGGTRDGVGVAATGIAGEGRDFHRFTGRNIVFEANATGEGLTKTVTVVIRGDEVAEPDEVLTLRLNNLRTSDPRVRFSGNGKRLEVTGTITNDD